MKNKNEVYVEVRTKKQARKLKCVLDMFGERIYRGTRKGLETGKDSDGDSQFDYPYIGFDTDGEWCGFRNVSKGEVTKVSIKELRNILAADHLKEGDVCVFKDLGGEYTDIYERMSPNFKGQFEAKEGVYRNFIRYATEEEKALLEPNKELEVGKWYKDPGYPKFLSIHTKDGNRYGFDIYGKWFEGAGELHYSSGYVQATTEEVEQALIEEAKRRGYKSGCTIKSINYGYKIRFKDIQKFSLKGCSLCMYAEAVLTDSDGDTEYNDSFERVFQDGKWAEVINTGKLKAEIDTTPIKEAFEKLGYAINDLMQHESPEQKVVKYAESVDWDLEKVRMFINYASIGLSLDEYEELTGAYSREKTEHIFNKHNPNWELKKAHKEGKEIEVYCGGNWHDCDPMWLNHCEYRIKPLYAGDWVMYYSGDIKKYTIITESNLDHFSKRECKRVKDAKLIELLNNNK